MRQKQLQIDWEDRHREFVVQQLAEMRKMSDAADLTVREFAQEWRIQTVLPDGSRDQAGYARMLAIRDWLYRRIKFMMLDDRMAKWQKMVAERRADWLKNFKAQYRLANRAARVEALERIVETATREKHFHAAIRGLLAIAQEVGELKISIDGSMTVNHHHYNVQECTYEELKRIVGGEDPLLVVPKWRKQ